MNDESWNALEANWNAVDRVPDLDLRWRRKRLRHRLEAVGDLVGIVFATVVCGFFLWVDFRPVTVVLAAFVLPFVYGSVVWNWRLRRRLTLELPSDPARFVETLKSNHETELRMLRAAKTGLVAVAVFSGVWLAWKLSVDWAVYQENPMAGFIGVGGALLILGGVFWQTRRRSSELDRQGERIAEIAASYEAEPG